MVILLKQTVSKFHFFPKVRWIFISSCFLVIEDERKRLQELKKLVGKLPEANKAVLKRLLALLAKIADHEEENKMGPTNLSTVIGPNILYDRQINPLTMVEDMENANSIIVSLISKFSEIFKIDDPIVAARENEYPSLVRLHKEGKDITVTDTSNGMTVLHYGAKHSNVDMVEFALKCNSSPSYVDAIDQSGKTVSFKVFLISIPRADLFLLSGFNVIL